MNKIKGLTIGIGSLPFKEVDKALEMVFKYAPNIPFWPQLPRRDVREGMIAQFSENLPFLSVDKEGLHYAAPDSQEKEEEALELFYERIIANNTDYFKISQDFALGLYGFYEKLENSDLKSVKFIKGHVTGPFTFAAGLKDKNGVSLLHNQVIMQAFLKGLGMKAIWQVELFKKFGKKIIIFFDEPFLGCFGSAHTPLNRGDVVRGLSELTKEVKASGDVLTGVHCCGNTDWSIFTEIETMDIINFDAFGFLERFVLYAEDLKGFIKRGGIICWGISPTQELDSPQTAQGLADKINSGINALVKKGLDKDLLLNKLLLSPSCGLGSLGIDRAEGALKLLSETSLLIKETA